MTVDNRRRKRSTRRSEGLACIVVGSGGIRCQMSCVGRLAIDLAALFSSSLVIMRRGLGFPDPLFQGLDSAHAPPQKMVRKRRRDAELLEAIHLTRVQDGLWGGASEVS